MDTPQTPVELRRRCRLWPPAVVRDAVLNVIATIGASRSQTEALAGLIAAWLTEDDDSEPPPLNERSVGNIWRELQQRRQ